MAGKAVYTGDPVFLPRDESSAWAWLPLGIRDTFDPADAAGADADVGFAFGDAAKGSLGRPMGKNRYEVELALQASRWLGSSVLQPAAHDHDPRGRAHTAPSLAAKLAIGAGLLVIAIRYYRKLGKPKPPKSRPSGRRTSTT